MAVRQFCLTGLNVCSQVNTASDENGHRLYVDNKQQDIDKGLMIHSDDLCDRATSVTERPLPYKSAPRTDRYIQLNNRSFRRDLKPQKGLENIRMILTPRTGRQLSENSLESGIDIGSDSDSVSSIVCFPQYGGHKRGISPDRYSVGSGIQNGRHRYGVSPDRYSVGSGIQNGRHRYGVSPDRYSVSSGIQTPKSSQSLNAESVINAAYDYSQDATSTNMNESFSSEHLRAVNESLSSEHLRAVNESVSSYPLRAVNESFSSDHFRTGQENDNHQHNVISGSIFSNFSHPKKKKVPTATLR